MNELETLKVLIQKECDKHFEIYYCKPVVRESSLPFIIWSDKSVNEFIEFAKKVKIEVVYFAELRGGVRHLQHKVDIAYIELSFIYDGLFHVFREYADWAVEHADAEKIEEAAKFTISTGVNDLVKEVVEYLERENPKALDDLDEFHEYYFGYWEDLGLDEEIVYELEDEVRHKIEKVRFAIEDEIKVNIERKESEHLGEYITKCYNWCKKRGLKKLTKTNAKAFLAENRMKLSQVNLDALYYKINDLLKNGV